MSEFPKMVANSKKCVRLSELGEFGIISSLARICSSTLSNGLIGIGDDCAILPLSALTSISRRFTYATRNSLFSDTDVGGYCNVNAGNLLFTADSLVSGVHFIPGVTATAISIGSKSLSVSLSDIASMGGVPIAATVCLHAPPDLCFSFVEELYEGLSKKAKQSGCAIVGGDTVKAQDLAVSVAVIGFCDGEPLTRTGASEGDDIWVSGEVGLSGAGMKILMGEVEKNDDIDLCITAHTEPSARLELGYAIRKGAIRKGVVSTRIATACIDISDGLVQDIGHISKMSSLDAVLKFELLPVSNLACYFVGFDYALTAGEDYELIFTASPKDREKVRSIGESLSLEKLQRIGSMEKPMSDTCQVFLEFPCGGRIIARDYFYDTSLGFSHF